MLRRRSDQIASRGGDRRGHCQGRREDPHSGGRSGGHMSDRGGHLGESHASGRTLRQSEVQVPLRNSPGTNGGKIGYEGGKYPAKARLMLVRGRDARTMKASLG